MPGFHLYQSNRLERLAKALSQRVSGQGGDPIVPVTVVVQNQGMARWLSLVLAEELGVWANARFPFPNAILWEVYEQFLPGEKPGELFETLPLAFRAMKILREWGTDDPIYPLDQYLGHDQEDLRSFQLASRLADLYDQYATYRPEWILDWAQGEGSDWRARLWRKMISAEEQAGHRPALFRRFARRVEGCATPIEGLPDPLYIFGISTLPPLHLETLAAIARFVEVHLYLLNPCREFWADIRSDKVQVKQVQRLKTPADPEDLHYERGHAQLASQGSLGQEFLHLLQRYDTRDEDLWVDPGISRLLCRLQQDILVLSDRPVASRIPIPARDDSVRIHSCHGPMREMEVLRDVLLRKFEEDPDLEPRHILVMAPEIEAYAPYIDAVFGGESDPSLSIPFSIADRGREQEEPLIRAFFRLLDLQGGRFRASEVLDLLEEPPLAAALDLGVVDLEKLRFWVAETRIRWGVDGAFRAALDLPPHPHHTWREGLDRLLLGYALPGDNERMFAGLLPCDVVEGESADLLGRFCRFADRLFEAISGLQEPRSLRGWQAVFQDLADGFLRGGDEDGLVVLHSALAELVRCQELSGLEEAVSYEVARAALERGLEAPSTAGFLRGGVTFCSLLPMRSIPFKLLALVGMNDGEFPRRTRRSGLDLMAERQRMGDPSRRKEDRYLFLEAILSAREALHISYVGQSARDNSLFPPSVAVSELLDTLEQKYASEDGGELRDQLEIRHRLQAFHPDYFRPGGRIFSYSEENYRGALSLCGLPASESPFVVEGLSEPGEEWRSLAVGDLVSFYRHPTRFFLRRRLGIRLEDREEMLPDSEPFALEGLERYQLKQDLVADWLAGRDPEESFRLAGARGLLPPAPLARPAFEESLAAAAGLARQVASRVAGEVTAESLNVDLRIGTFRIQGLLPDARPDGLLRYRCARLRARDRLSLWIEHLVLCCLGNGKTSPESLLLGEGGASCELSAVSACEDILLALLDGYWQGLRAPLPFFPETSLAYARKACAGEEESRSLAAARSAWEGSVFSRGERDDAEHDYVYRGGDPLGAAFRTISRGLLLPLLRHGRGV